MIQGLAIAVIAVSLTVAVWAFFLAWRRRPVGRAALVGAAVVELVALAQVVVAVVLLVRGERPTEVATFVGYLAATLVVLPIGAWWAKGDPSRAGAVVLGVACLVLPVLVARLQQIWAVTGG